MQEFLNRVLHGNCSEIMARMPDEYIDLTVTSPPYDNLRNYKGYSFPFEDIAKQLYRITKQGGVVVWVVGDATIKGSETGTSFRQALFLKEIGFNLHDTMIWKKPNPIPTQSTRYQQGFEYMFVFTKGKPKTFNPLKERSKFGGVNVKKHRATKDKHTYNEEGFYTVSEYKTKCNVWEIANTKNKTFHPAVFPEQLASDHINTWSVEGDTILDCFCGSGTTLKMAYLNNRNFIGIDYSSEYVELSKKRLEQVMS